MPKQTGPCAFSNACVNPGPHVRVGFTNRFVCVQHQHLIQISTSPAEAADLTSRVTVRRSRASRGSSSWPIMAGIVTGSY